MVSVNAGNDGVSRSSRRKKRKSQSTQINIDDRDYDDSDDREPADLDELDKQRNSHRRVEERRRKKMSMYITELSHLLPNCDQPNKKMDKLMILKLAVQHLGELRGNPSDEDRPLMKSQFLTGDELKCLILEAADGFLFVVGCEEGKFIYVSDSVYPILKQSQHDWMGKKLDQLIHPRDVSKVKDQLATGGCLPAQPATNAKRQACLAAGSRCSFFCRMRCGPSANYHTEEEEEQSSDDSSLPPGKVYYTVVHVTGYIKPWKLPPDIAAGIDDTDAEKLCLVAIGRLQTTEASHVATDSVPVAKDFISRHSIDGTFSFVDKRVMEVLGYMPHELVGLSMYEFYHRDDVPRLAEDHKAVLNSGSPEVVESIYRFRNKSGRWVWIKSKFFGFRNPYTKRLDYIMGHNFILSRDGAAQLPLNSRHAMTLPDTPPAGSVPDSPLSAIAPSPSVALTERTPPATQPVPAVSSALLPPNSFLHTQRQCAIRQDDFVEEMLPTAQSYQSSGCMYGSSPSERPSLSVASSVSQGHAGGLSIYDAANSQAGPSVSQSNPPHFQQFQPQLHQRRVTVGQCTERRSLQATSQDQAYQLFQNTQMTTYTTHAQQTPHTLLPPLPNFSQIQPSFPQAQFPPHPLYQPSGQTHAPFHLGERDEAVNSMDSFFPVPEPTVQQAPQQGQVHTVHAGPSQGMPSCQYQHHM